MLVVMVLSDGVRGIDDNGGCGNKDDGDERVVVLRSIVEMFIRRWIKNKAYIISVNFITFKLSRVILH